MAEFIPTDSTIDAEKFARIFYDNIVCRHGVPRSVVSDRGSKFTSAYWGEVTKALSIKLNMSTAFHPQTDGQTERVNQILEQYIRIYCSYQQDDWASFLPSASFAYNNAEHATTRVSPFFANYGYHPRFAPDEWDLNALSTSSTEMVEQLSDVHDLCKKNIELANIDYAKYYNRKRGEAPLFEVGDSVLLNLANITTKRPSKKFDIKQAGPFKVIGKVGLAAYRLELPPTMRNHNVFHVALLRPFREPTYEGQTYDPPGPVEVDDDDGLGERYEVKAIVDSRIYRNKLQYKVEWEGYAHTDEAATWQNPIDLCDCQDLVDEFHRKHPDKPRNTTPRWIEGRSVGEAARRKGRRK